MPVISEQVVMLRGIQWGKKICGTLSIMSLHASVHLEQFSCLQWDWSDQNAAPGFLQHNLCFITVLLWSKKKIKKIISCLQTVSAQVKWCWSVPAARASWEMRRAPLNLQCQPASPAKLWFAPPPNPSNNYFPGEILFFFKFFPVKFKIHSKTFHEIFFFFFFNSSQWNSKTFHLFQCLPAPNYFNRRTGLCTSVLLNRLALIRGI